MASKDSVRFLAQSIGGLGDRLRQSAQDTMANTRADVSLGLQNRYAGLAEGREVESVKKMRKAEANSKFEKAMTILATPLARAAKSDNPTLFFDQVAAQAYQALPEEDRALVNMEQYGLKPSQKRFTEAYPSGPTGKPYPPSLAQRAGKIASGAIAINPVDAIMGIAGRLRGR